MWIAFDMDILRMMHILPLALMPDVHHLAGVPVLSRLRKLNGAYRCVVSRVARGQPGWRQDVGADWCSSDGYGHWPFTDKKADIFAETLRALVV